ncbi:MAG: stage II sporulation protein P [Clostridia bacterium]|nr:stage II sporulation protein P [Clostridia bacterium]
MEEERTLLAPLPEEAGETQETALIVPPDVSEESADTNFPAGDVMPAAEPSPEADKSAGLRRERASLVIRLCLVCLATVAVIVYGSCAAVFLNTGVPLAERLLGEVLGTPVILHGNVYAAPPLGLIPPQTVTEGEAPGAAEQESVPEAPPITEEGRVYPILSMDLSVTDDPFAIVNETPYSPNREGLLAVDGVPSLSELQSTYGADAPVVLIIHTHGTEAYSAHGASEYADGESFRSLTPEDGVVSVGREMKKVFESHGIGVIHIETMFDAEDFNSAYLLAAEQIRRVCREYPSVSYVFDVHRDAMVAADGTGIRPLSPSTSTVEGVSAAQIMLVVGTDHAGSGHTGWQENLSIALKLQKAALDFDPDLMRPLNLRSASFNQQYTPGSLIVEVGAAANSVEEARLSGMIFAEAAARVINQ